MSERGSAPVEAALSVTILMLAVLGVVEIALALYGRNVALASVHEGARAAVELGRNPNEAAEIARNTVRQAAGGLVDDLYVSVQTIEVEGRSMVTVKLNGRFRVPGPVPIPVPLDISASAFRAAKWQ